MTARRTQRRDQQDGRQRRVRQVQESERLRLDCLQEVLLSTHPLRKAFVPIHLHNWLGTPIRTHIHPSRTVYCSVLFVSFLAVGYSKRSAFTTGRTTLKGCLSGRSSSSGCCSRCIDERKIIIGADITHAHDYRTRSVGG